MSRSGRVLASLFFLSVSLLAGLISLSGLAALIHILRSGHGRLMMNAVLVAQFVLIAWLSGRQAYRTAVAPPAGPGAGEGRLGPAAKALAAAAVVLGALALIAAPMFRELPLKSREGALRGRLGALREALGRYRDETGAFPKEPAELTAGRRFLDSIPAARVPYSHEASAGVRLAESPDDAGGWLYDAKQGRLSVNCTHTDSRGRAWDAY